MIVAILCPGPSLAEHRAIDGPTDIVLAVNTALNHPIADNTVDWWVALDVQNRYPLPTKRPLHGLVTTQAAIDEGQSQHVPYPLYPLNHYRAWRPTATTLPSAIQFAGILGAEEVQLYGCDMIDAPDFIGNHGSIRTPERWEREITECREAADRFKIDLFRRRPDGEYFEL